MIEYLIIWIFITVVIIILSVNLVDIFMHSKYRNVMNILTSLTPMRITNEYILFNYSSNLTHSYFIWISTIPFYKDPIHKCRLHKWYIRINGEDIIIPRWAPEHAYIEQLIKNK